MTNEEAIKAIKDNYPPSRYTMLREALNMAIEALEKQMAKEPIYKRREDWGGVGKCPQCKGDNINHEYHKAKFCFNCGQALDWSRR